MARDQLARPPAREQARPDQPGRVDGGNITLPGRRKPVEPVGAIDEPRAVAVAVVMRQFELTVRRQLDGNFAEHVRCGGAPVRGTERSGIESVGVSEDVLKARRAGVTDPDVRKVRAACGIRDQRAGIRNDAVLCVDAQEIVGAIVHDWPGNRPPILPGGEPRHGISGRILADQGTVGQIRERRAVRGVRPRFRHGVREATREAPLADVERRHQHLDLLESLDGNRPRQRPSPWEAPRVQVVVHASVDLELVEQSILAADGDASRGSSGRRRGHGHLRAQGGQREKVTTEIRQRGDPCRRDDLGGSGAARVELGISRGVDRHRRQLDGGRQERELGDEALVEGEHDAGPGLGCEPEGTDLDAIGPAYCDVLEEITAARPCRDSPATPIRKVRDADARPGDRRAVLTRHSPLNRRRRDALRVQ